jgi:hypothetical protein
MFDFTLLIISILVLTDNSVQTVTVALSHTPDAGSPRLLVLTLDAPIRRPKFK